jgi:hypothetical protein
MAKSLDCRLNIALELDVGGEANAAGVVYDVAQVLLRKNSTTFRYPQSLYTLVVLKYSPNKRN